MNSFLNSFTVRFRTSVRMLALLVLFGLLLQLSSSQLINSNRRSPSRVLLRHMPASDLYDSPFVRQPPFILSSGRYQHPLLNRVHFASNVNSNHFSPIVTARQPARRDIVFPVSNDLIDNEPPLSTQDSLDRSGLTPFQKIKFISPKQELAQTRWWYDAPVTFSAKEMEHLYLLNRYIMEWIQPTPGLPDGFITDQILSDPKEVIKHNRVQLVTHFWGLSLATVIAFFCAITAPIVGFLICCCRCTSGRSKSSVRARRHSRLEESPRPSHRQVVVSSKSRRQCKYRVENKCDPCVRSISSSLFFCILLGITFFVICAFVTNEYVKTGLHQLPHSLNQSLDDVQLYLNNTQFEVSTLFVTNFNQLDRELSNNLDKSGTIIKNRLALVSQAIALENLTEIVMKLDEIHSDLDQLSKETDGLSSMLSDLRLGLRKAKDDLEDVFKTCAHVVCSELKQKYEPLLPKMQVSPQFDRLPNMSTLIQEITELLQSDIVHEVQRGKQAFDRIGARIQSVVNSTIPEIKHQVSLVGRELLVMAEDINEALRLPFHDIQTGKHAVYEGSRFINEYEHYRWYAGLAGAGFVLCILSLYSLGLMCGSCKSQPSLYDYRTRRLNPPPTWPLTCGTVLVFMFFGIVLLATIGLFLSGTLMDRIGCYYLEHASNPEGHKLFELLQKRFDVNRRSFANGIQFVDANQPNVVDVIDRCHQNVSLFRALDFERNHKFLLKNNRLVDANNLDSILDFKTRYQIEERLDKLLNAVDVNPGNISILSEKGYNLLNRLRGTSLGTFNFSMFAGLLNQKVTSIDLLAISNDLNKGAHALPAPEIENRSKLKYISFVIDSYQTRMFSEIQDSIRKLKDGARKIEKKAQYGSKGLQDALAELIEQTRQAQRFLTQNGKSEVRKVAKAFKTDLSSLIDQYANHVKDQVHNQIGRCEPVSRAVNASIVSVCKEIILPYNGYWYSIASALLLFIPAAFFASILSGSFSKLKRNKDHRIFDNDMNIESLEDDDIPLAHVGPKNENYAYESRRNMQYACPAPSAPLPAQEENWTSGPPTLPMYSRPPPYNFDN